MVCQGCIISGGHVRRSILSPNVRVNSYALVENSILFDGVDVGRHCRIRRAIIDKDVKIPPHTTIGYDLDHDRRRGFRSPSRASWSSPRPSSRHFSGSRHVPPWRETASRTRSRKKRDEA